MILSINIPTPFGERRIEINYDVRWRSEPDRLSVRETGIMGLEHRHPVVHLLRDLADALTELANREDPNSARVRLNHQGLPR